MQKLELFDETFDPDRTESYELSIQVSLNGFSFCIKDLTRDFFIGLGSCPFNSSAVSSDDWIQQVSFIANTYKWMGNSFKRVLFCYVSPSFCLAPKHFFNPEQAKNLLSASHQIDDLDEVRFNERHESMVSVYNVPSTLITSWLRVQSKSRIIGYCDPPLNFHLINFLDERAPVLTISFNSKFAVITISKDQKILHCGSIDTLNVDDTLYHMVNICNTLGVETSKTKVVTMGYHSKSNMVLAMIERFFGEVSTVSKNQQNHFSYLLNNYQSKFASLFNQTLCE
ncbi:MAG: DUF3822 family protein [Bacteroidales bacterium]